MRKELPFLTYRRELDTEAFASKGLKLILNLTQKYIQNTLGNVKTKAKYALTPFFYVNSICIKKHGCTEQFQMIMALT